MNTIFSAIFDGTTQAISEKMIDFEIQFVQITRRLFLSYCALTFAGLSILFSAAFIYWDVVTQIEKKGSASFDRPLAICGIMGLVSIGLFYWISRDNYWLRLFGLKQRLDRIIQQEANAKSEEQLRQIVHQMIDARLQEKPASSRFSF